MFGWIRLIAQGCTCANCPSVSTERWFGAHSARRFEKPPIHPLNTQKSTSRDTFFVVRVDSFNSAGLHLCKLPKRQHRKVVRCALRTVVFLSKNHQIHPSPKLIKALAFASAFILVERGGFEPPKSLTTDLQSAPFGHSGTSPYGAGDRNRTNNLLITNQLLCLLSYTSILSCWCLGADSNHRHRDFQSLALPPELPRHTGFQSPF